MSKHLKAKQREAKERGDAARAASQAYAAGQASTKDLNVWLQHGRMLRTRRKQARKDGLKSAQELRAIAARFPVTICPTCCRRIIGKHKCSPPPPQAPETPPEPRIADATRGNKGDHD